MLNWFTRRGVAPRAQPSPQAPARAETKAHLSALPPGAPHAVPPASVTPPTGASLAASFTRMYGRLGERARALVAALEPGPCADDVRLLVDLLLNSEGTGIRPIPTAAKRALSLARNPESSLLEVADAFERDPSLAEGLLRMANSAWYRGGDEPVESLGDALQRTGSSGAEIVIMENALKGTLCRPGGAYDAMVTQVWLHLSRTAPIARALAVSFGPEPESAFMLGLLHDAGKLVLFDAMSELRRRARRAMHLPYPVLRELLMELHEPLGGLAMLRWGLDLERARAVADHHRRTVPQVTDPVSELLFVAERTDLALTAGRTCEPPRWIAEGGLTIGAQALRRALVDATGGSLRVVARDDDAGATRAA